MKHESDTPIRRLVSIAGLGLAGAIALTGCSLLEEAATDEATDTTEVSADQVDAAADAAPGDCLHPGFLDSTADEFTIDCSDPTAVWTITAITADSGATAGSDGMLVDNQPLFDLCGEEVGAYIPGQPLTDWNLIYDPTTGAVDYLFCIEATTTPDADGGLMATPNVDECFGSADIGYVVPCDSALAEYTATGFVELELGEYAAADLEAAAVDCGEDWYFELTDQFNRTSGLLCAA